MSQLSNGDFHNGKLSELNSTLESPSIFVLFAEDNLSLTLRNAIKFTLKFFTNRYSNILYRFSGNLDEIQLLLDLLIQWSYLERWNSTFTERFFSLQRFSLKGSRLNQSEIVWSLIVHSGLPYILGKLDLFYEKIRDKQLTIERFASNDLTLQSLTKHEEFILQYYPILKQLYQSFKIILWILYSAGNSYSHSVPFWFLLHSQKLSYSVDMSAEEKNVSKLSKLGLAILLTKFSDFTLKSGTFLVQFLEYWYSHSDVRQLLATSKSTLVPPPPPAQNKISSLSPELCPLCLQKRVNETALASSGYVFCYLCIFDYVQGFGQCPVTRFPSTLEQLVRVFG